MWQVIKQQERRRNEVGEALTFLFLNYVQREPIVRDLKLISIYGKIIPIVFIIKATPTRDGYYFCIQGVVG